MPERFLDIKLPEEFVLEVPAEAGGWTDYGLYRADQFGRDDDGTYVCAGYGASPLFLRCVRQRGDVIEVLDGTGAQFTYRLVPFPNEQYQRS